MSGRSVLITGAGGYLGTQLLAALQERGGEVGRIVAVDVRDFCRSGGCPASTTT